MAGVKVAQSPREIHAAALARKKERHTPYEAVTEAERRQAWMAGQDPPRRDPFGPQYAPPASAGQFMDDRITEWGGLLGDPAAPVLLGIADAARDSAEAAVAAVRAARQLEPAVQWTAFQNLEFWRAHELAPKTGAERVINAVLAEWRRLGLAEEDPGDE